MAGTNKSCTTSLPHVAGLQVRAGLSGLGAATAEHSGILGHLMKVAAAVAKQVRGSRVHTTRAHGRVASPFTP